MSSWRLELSGNGSFAIVSAQPGGREGRLPASRQPPLTSTLGIMKYSLRKLISTDWPTLAASLGLPIIWAINFGFPYLGPTKLPLPLWFPVSISSALIIWLIWRIIRVARLFAKGHLSLGRVTDLSIAKDRGRLEFAFEYQGKLISTWTPVHKTKAVRSLAPGAVVEVLFDASRPTRAIVKHLYEA